MFEQLFLITGAAFLFTLGILHLISTYITNEFFPENGDVTEAMKSTSPVLTKNMSMWDAWIGFNASHSLGIIAIALFYLVLAVSYIEIIDQTKIFSVLAVMIGLSYLLLAKRYWFRFPFVGILMATLCFLTSAILVFN